MMKGIKMIVASCAVLGLVLFMADAQSAPAKKAAPAKTPPPIKAVAPAKVASAPICDLNAHPKITKVTPDTVTAGERITIKGTKFGSKECFQNVSFGPTGTKDFRYVNDSTVEATVPNLKPGMVPVNVLTAGGSAQFMVLVKK
jgi:hypothetical protein